MAARPGISKALMDMKFMQRTKKKFEMKEAQKKELAEKKRLLGEGPSQNEVVVKQEADEAPQYEFVRSYDQLEDLRFGRFSFKGFNPEVEKLMIFHERLRKGLPTEDSEEEAEVNNAEMAEALGGSLRKKFQKKGERTPQEETTLRDETVGKPSGRFFNEICLDPSGYPHNPMVNSGAIGVASLLQPDLDMADRFEHVLTEYKEFAGGEDVGPYVPAVSYPKEQPPTGTTRLPTF
ncbi:unnamed protein product, partial [Mesorhabditis spiculigera]